MEEKDKWTLLVASMVIWRITTATCHLMPDNNSKNTMEDTKKHLLTSNNNLLERTMATE